LDHSLHLAAGYRHADTRIEIGCLELLLHQEKLISFAEQNGIHLSEPPIRMRKQTVSCSAPWSSL